MTRNAETVILWRPIRPVELEPIRAAGMRAIPPRQPDQPIFDPVLAEEYAGLSALGTCHTHRNTGGASSSGISGSGTSILTVDGSTPEPLSSQ